MTAWLPVPLLTLLLLLLQPLASDATALLYPGCASDSDCIGKPLFRCSPTTKNVTTAACTHNNGQVERCTCTGAGGHGFRPTPINASATLPKYLMIGDSISIGMHSHVFTALADVLQGYHNEGNANNANYGAHGVGTWLTSKPPGAKWNIITYNFGLHGLAKDQELITVAEYSALLRQITKTLKQTGAKLLFINTTPVPTNPDPSNKTSLVMPPRFDTDVQAFNAAAATVLAAESVPIHDLYSVVHNHCAGGPPPKNYASCDWQLPNNVHYKPAGWKALADDVASAVRKLV
jgi:lysophospholipase L1-like esterase